MTLLDTLNRRARVLRIVQADPRWTAGALAIVRVYTRAAVGATHAQAVAAAARLLPPPPA